MNGQALKLSKHDHFLVGPKRYPMMRVANLSSGETSKHMVLRVDDHDHLYLCMYHIWNSHQIQPAMFKEHNTLLLAICPIISHYYIIFM